MARRSRQVVVVSDSSKVGMVSPAVICSAVDIDVLITGDGISHEAIQCFTDSGVKIVSFRQLLRLQQPSQNISEWKGTASAVPNTLAE
jgi:predicted Fe-Mo cluster-binding NifX family protein